MIYYLNDKSLIKRLKMNNSITSVITGRGEATVGPKANRFSRILFCIGCMAAVFCICVGCGRSAPDRLQGYVEGEFVYVASPLAGALTTLYVQRGAQVKAGEPLFALESASEKDVRDQAQAALTLSDKDFARQEKLMRTPGGTSKQDFDRTLSARDQDRHRVAKAEWDLAQKRQAAPKSGLVFDTLYREGEWIAAGRPVVVLLPPENIKVRTFVPETEIGAIQLGSSVKVFADGASAPVAGKVSFISPKVEFTPPVIYSRESRSKLVIMVEVVFDPKEAVRLHPGQPVDVQFGS
jgi:HlyD family secretion protein